MKKQIIALATDKENVVMWDMDALLADCKELVILRWILRF